MNDQHFARLPKAIAAVVLCFAAANAHAQQQPLEGKALIDALGSGGYVLVVRHANAPAPAAQPTGAPGAAPGGRGAPPGGAPQGGAPGARGAPPAGGAPGAAPAGRGGPPGGAAPAGGPPGGAAAGGRGGPPGGGGGRGGGRGGGGGGGGPLSATDTGNVIAMSFAFRELDLPVGPVVTSPAANAVAAAELFYFGERQQAPELGPNGNSAWLRTKASEAPPAGKNALLVTNRENISAAFGNAVNDVEDWEALIFRPSGSNAALVGRMTPKEWAQLALAASPAP